LRDKVDVTFVLNFRRTCVFFAKDLPGFESGFDCYVKIGFEIFWQKTAPEKEEFE